MSRKEEEEEAAAAAAALDGDNETESDFQNVRDGIGREKTK